ncbi:MAG: hypothetical protein R2788_00870 [Saprospiraceae bacterium]
MKTAFGIDVPDLDPSTVNIHEIDGSYVNQTLTVKIKEKVHNNVCWGYIVLKDKLGPTFDCPTAPFQVSCALNSPGATTPVLIDNCDPNPTVTFVGEQVIDNDICDDGIYRTRRTYTGIDIWATLPSANVSL